MLNPVDEYHGLILKNLVNDPIVAPASRPKTLKLSYKGVAKSVGVVCDRSEYRVQRRISNFDR